MSTAAYRDLENLPTRAIGELFDGQLHAQSRPAFPHVHVHSSIVISVGAPFHNGIGGPGGWMILDEPEIHFTLDLDVTVPYLAGWRRCQAPCDYIPRRSYPLLQAREVLRLLAEEGIEGSGKEAEPRGDGV